MPGGSFRSPGTRSGAEAEVDFGELWVVLNGMKTKCHIFEARFFRLSSRATGHQFRFQLSCRRTYWRPILAYTKGLVRLYILASRIPPRNTTPRKTISAVDRACDPPVKALKLVMAR